MLDAYIYDGLRTPFGRHAGALAPVRPDDLLADVIRAHNILRLKGFVAITGKPMRLTLQAVGPRVDTYFDQPFGAQPRETRLVVIGQSPLDRAAISERLEKAFS